MKLRSHMANKVYVVIEVAYKVIRDIMCCTASVPDELPFRHFVFDMRAGQVDGQQDQTVAQHIHCICREMTVDSDQIGLFLFLMSFQKWIRSIVASKYSSIVAL